MKPRMLVWLAVCAGVVLVLSANAAVGWVIGTVVAAALVMVIPLSMKRLRAERNLARTFWRALTTRVIAAVVLLSAATSVSAHHTIARVDDVSHTVALTGMVTRIAWKQPHVIYDVAVTNQNGERVVWEIESRAPHIMHREGIEPTTMKVGDRVTMNVYVALDGTPHAATESVVLPDGRVVRLSMKGATPPNILPKGTALP